MKYYVTDKEKQWDVRCPQSAFQKESKQKEMIRENCALVVVPQTASITKYYVKAKKIVTVVCRKRYVVQKLKTLMVCIAQKILLPMIVQYNVMKRSEKFYVQRTIHLSDANPKPCVCQDLKTEMENIAQLILPVQRNVVGMKFCVLMVLTLEDAKMLIYAYLKGMIEMVIYALDHVHPFAPTQNSVAQAQSIIMVVEEPDYALKRS